MLKAVRRLSVADAVYEQLRDAILEGELLPGAELPSERVLSEKLAVNRGAVREALKRLEQTRLIAIQHGGTTRVLNFRQTAALDLVTRLLAGANGAPDAHVARSLVELSATLAPDVVRLAAERGDPELPAQLREIARAMRESRLDPPRLHVLTQRFWDAVVRESGNIAYQLIFNTIREANERFGEVMLPLVQECYADGAGYADLIDAIERRDPDSAVRAARRHMEPVVQRLTHRLDRKPLPRIPELAS